MKIKSVVIKEPGQLVIDEHEVAQPLAGEVRVKVQLAGICGSDVHIYRGHNPFAKYPRVIGHEFFGVIDAVGEGVSADKLGKRVSVDPVISCGHCYPCQIGRPNVCKELTVLGVHRDGGFSESTCVPAGNAHEIADHITDEMAVMIEPFTIAANICEQLKPTSLDTALVYGAGPMGLTTIQALKNVYQVKQVIVADRIPERLAMAKACGADVLIDNTHQPLKDTLSAQGILPTLIIDAACHPSILDEATRLISPAGRIGIMGFSSEPCTITQQAITSKELTIFSSRLNSNKFPLVISWLNNQKINPDALITHKFSINEVETALAVFEKDQKNCCKVLLEISK
ncbi:Zn-dependent oxidoreductase [Tolumonas osonensis]|uniref:L-gulonate 5-dehydrogenase n=1 Tax=Tolumonas osonensis TaxID=675874 RepID=A0A841GN52_9GAMM|nr:Zn-dependent oxidoreductase [Tolumonas osonensis]MBB6056551.1 L-gulonate 5-dehydrogenase [Tolumonas osonensis]